MDLLSLAIGLVIGVCLGGALIAVVTYGRRLDDYDEGFRDGTDWAELQDKDR